MQRIYDDLGMSIEPGCGPDTTDDLVSFALTGTDERVSIVNSLRYQPDGIQTCATTLVHCFTNVQVWRRFSAGCA